MVLVFSEGIVSFRKVATLLKQYVTLEHDAGIKTKLENCDPEPSNKVVKTKIDIVGSLESLN